MTLRIARKPRKKLERARKLTLKVVVAATAADGRRHTAGTTLTIRR